MRVDHSGGTGPCIFPQLTGSYHTTQHVNLRIVSQPTWVRRSLDLLCQYTAYPVQSTVAGLYTNPARSSGLVDWQSLDLYQMGGLPRPPGCKSGKSGNLKQAESIIPEGW